MSKTIAFGWDAPSFAEQLPDLPPSKAAGFDLDNRAIIRLHLRGFLTDSQRDAAIKKVTRDIGLALGKTERGQ
jgi:hypothetical protein